MGFIYLSIMGTLLVHGQTVEYDANCMRGTARC